MQTLAAHAVPLDERAIANLSHSALGLDLYAWLAQRLHRVPPHKPQFITWPALKDQFGYHSGAMFKFNQVFRGTLRTAKTQYPGARFDLTEKGNDAVRESAVRCQAPCRSHSEPRGGYPHHYCTGHAEGREGHEGTLDPTPSQPIKRFDAMDTTET